MRSQYRRTNRSLVGVVVAGVVAMTSVGLGSSLASAMTTVDDADLLLHYDFETAGASPST